MARYILALARASRVPAPSFSTQRARSDPSRRKTHPDLPPSRLGRAGSARDLVIPDRGGRGSAGPRGGARLRHRGDRHRQPARNHHRLGPPHRLTRLQRHRLAGQAHRGSGLQGAGLRDAFRKPHRSADRSLLLGDEALLDPRSRAGRPAVGGAGGARVRHRRQLVGLEAGPRARHVTDASNASRTLLFNIHTGGWDDELPAMMGIPRACCRRWSSRAVQSHRPTRPATSGPDPIAGIAGDQQAALFGQTCQAGHGEVDLRHRLLHAHEYRLNALHSNNRLLATVAWKIGERTEYALEGSVFIGGAVDPVAARRLKRSAPPTRSSGSRQRAR